MLEYLTKYSAKAGKPTKQLTALFDEVLTDIASFEKEDGSTDLWRRTIMKFYNRVIGNRDYTLFEVVHFGIGLPPTISSFGTVDNASVSDWHALKMGAAMSQTQDDADAFYANKKDQFANRGDYVRPATISPLDLENISFYAFHRQFYVQKNRLHRRQKERFLSVTGLGFPAQASRDHADHEFYARRTLYAYMPCADLQGVEYIDTIVAEHYAGLYSRLLREFIENDANIWCPTWVRQNTKCATSSYLQRPRRGKPHPRNLHMTQTLRVLKRN